MTILILQIGLLVFLLYLSSVFSGSETALFSLKSHQVRRLRSRPSRNSIKVESLLADPRHLLVTILVGNTLVNVAASSIGTNLVGQFFHENVVGISVVVMTVLILIFGEVVPKTFAASQPLRVSLATVPAISTVVCLLAPLRRVTEAAVSFADRLLPAGASSYEPDSPADVVEAIAMGHAEGVLDQFEREVLGRIFRIAHRSGQNIMTPRTEVSMLSSDVPLEEAVGIVKSSGFSRIPVFDAEQTALALLVVTVDHHHAPVGLERLDLGKWNQQSSLPVVRVELHAIRRQVDDASQMGLSIYLEGVGPGGSRQGDDSRQGQSDRDDTRAVYHSCAWHSCLPERSFRAGAASGLKRTW